MAAELPDLGRLPDDATGRPASWFEKIVEKVTPNDHAALGLRHVIFLLPAAVLVSPYLIAGAPLIVGLYEIAWRVRPQNPIVIAEILTGFAWGAAIVVV